ncbi:MAG: hypothetical protein ACH36H_09385, partial [Candidatus Nanopelagicales bacterium]
QAVAAATGLFSTASTWTSLVRNTGTGIGVIGTASSGVGVQGESSGAAGAAAGVKGAATGTAAGVWGTSAFGNGVEGDTTGYAYGVRGHSAGSVGVYGESDSGTGVEGVGAAGGNGVQGRAGVAGDTAAWGVVGYSPSGVGVHGTSDDGTGIYAASDSQAAIDARTTSGVAIVARSEQTEALRLTGVLANIPTYFQAAGSFFATTGGEVWLCVQSGSPGKWRLLASPASAGAFVAITPVRVYDSRWSGVPGVTTGLLAFGDKRPVSVAASRSSSGTVTDANAIPAGATALTVNLTITATQGSGNLAIVPGGVLTSATSSINWTGPGQALANGLTVPIRASDRTVNLLCNGTATQAILDVTGYFLGK